ncbi:MAG: molybdopterin-guanine dinucleotide biosynthesis protein B [Eubacteriaceae bacterium]
MCCSAVKNPKILGISGIKNSGKTTFIEKLVIGLRQRNLKVAVVKHDGHDFEADVEGTDSHRFFQAGAYGTAVFSENKFLVVKSWEKSSEKELILLFPEADLILLEGFKYSNYPKIELIRKGISKESVCKKETLMGIVTDTTFKIEGIPSFGFDEIDNVIDLFLKNLSIQG